MYSVGFMYVLFSGIHSFYSDLAQEFKHEFMPSLSLTQNESICCEGKLKKYKCINAGINKPLYIVTTSITSRVGGGHTVT